ncbi:MAG TPA: PhnD/SsuA/transferrin family substrate-binding protein [Gemmataceae bacterium]|nr:PhnD/SsuA/transferrin family substrate-binding protein [Gemmataceae bacterium]
MRQRTSCIRAAVMPAGLFIVLALGAGQTVQAADVPQVRIGLVQTLFRDVPDFLIPIGLRPMKVLMESQTGISGDLIPAGDPDHLARELKDNDMQLGVFHGVEFAWIHQKYPTLQPLVIAVNEHPYVRALLVVRADCACGAAVGLQGKVMALPRMSREHCRLFLQCRCCGADRAPDKFFSRVSTPGNPEDALDDVVDDNAQGAVVDEIAFNIYCKDKPGRGARLKVLQQSESFPCAVIAYQPGGLTQKQVDAFRDGLLKAHDNPEAKPLLQANHITGFEAVPAGYEKELGDILKAYPPPQK